jgi:hypothetical protein
MNYIKQQLLSGWNVIRWIRLIFGIAILIQAVEIGQPLIGIVAAILLFQAISNTGCCGKNGCSIPTRKKE